APVRVAGPAAAARTGDLPQPVVALPAVGMEPGGPGRSDHPAPDRPDATHGNRRLHRPAPPDRGRHQLPQPHRRRAGRGALATQVTDGNTPEIPVPCTDMRFDELRTMLADTPVVTLVTTRRNGDPVATPIW